MGRSRTPRDLADHQTLARIALLASHIMITLRQPGRGVFDSERQLRVWLSDDGYEFSNSDVSPALVLLEATGRIGRSTAKRNASRCGWLITSALGTSENVIEGAPDADAGAEGAGDRLRSLLDV